MRFLLYWDVRQRGFVTTDVMGEPVGPVFKDQAFQE
jgi:hypothetical protein